MGRYNFVSEGGAGAKAIEEFFVKQALEERQRMLDEQARAEQEAAIRQRDQQLAQQAERDAENARAGEATRTALEDERQFRRASTVASSLAPGVLDPGTADLLRGQGFGSLVREGLPQQGAQTGEDDGVPLYDVLPGVLETPGGFQWQQARQAADERAAQAQTAQQAQAERAAADREARAEQARQSDETRRMLGQMSAGAAASSRGVQDELTRLRIEQGRDKLNTEQTTRQQQADTAATQKQTLLELAQSLADDPELGRIAGWLDSRTTTVRPDSVALEDKLKRLTAGLSLDQASRMKGQGTITENERKLISEAVAGLNPAAGEENLRKRLRDIAAALRGGGAAPAAPTTETPEQRRARIIREARGR